MEKQLLIISEDRDSFTALINGKEVKLYKINTDEIEIKRRVDLYKAASFIPKEDVINAVHFVSITLDNIPNVDEYEEIAETATVIMNSFYKCLVKHKLSHIMHYLIKNTDPTIYGKAQTFMKQIRYFDLDLRIIEFFQEDMVGNKP